MPIRVTSQHLSAVPELALFLEAVLLLIVRRKGETMYFQVYDASGRLRFQSGNWPMARSALDLVISEGGEDGTYPVLLIGPEPKEDVDG